MTMTDDLRARLTAALNAAPASFVRDDPEDAASHFEREHRRHDRHKYYGGCALCRGEAETLADAAIAFFQDEDRHYEAVTEQQLQDTLRHLGRAERARDRYRLAWQSARQRAADNEEEVQRQYADCQQAERQLATVQDALGAVTGQARKAEAERDAARETNRRLNHRCQQAESKLATFERAVSEWRLGEQGTYVPLRSLATIANAADREIPEGRWELHYQRVERAEAERDQALQAVAQAVEDMAEFQRETEKTRALLDDTRRIMDGWDSIRAERDAALAALARVRLLHQRCTCRRAMELATDPVVHCDCCDEDWPCSTIQILDRPELAAVLAGPTEQPKRFMAGDFLRAPKTGETPTISREFDDSIELPDLGGPAAPAGAGGTEQDGG